MDAKQERPSADLGIEGITDAVRIGAGGYGTVYRARQEAFDRTVAVKVLRAPAFDEEVRRRFDRECRALGSLSGHPHIVAVHASGVAASGLCYLVLEYLPGGTLAQRMAASGPLPAAEVAGIGVKLAGALASAHAAGVLHRDLKPENILVSAYGEPQLVDFGVAHVEGGSVTQSGAITGTLAHAAPEVLSGERGLEAADVYSLASTLYALLAGQAPFVRSGEVAFFPLMARVLTEPPPDLRARGVPAELWQTLEQALVKDPAKRTASASALAGGLRAAAATSATGPVPAVAPLAPAPQRPEPSADQDAAALGEADDLDDFDRLNDLDEPGDPDTVSIRGAWAKPVSPLPPPPLLPRRPPAPFLGERLGSKRKVGLIAAAAIAALMTVIAVVALRPSSPTTDLATNQVGSTTTTVAQGPAGDPGSGSATTTSVPDDVTVSPTTVAPVAPPAPQATTPLPTTRPPSSPATNSVTRPPPVGVAGPPPVDYPACATGDFDLTNVANSAQRTTMRQRTCAEELSDGSVKASVILYELDRSSDDRIQATYRVELRHCQSDATLSSGPEGSGSGVGDGSPVFEAGTGGFQPAVYAVAEIGDLKLTTASSGGDVTWVGNGLAQQTRDICPR